MLFDVSQSNESLRSDDTADAYQSITHENVVKRIDQAQLSICGITSTYQNNVNRVNGMKPNRNSFEFHHILSTKKLPKMIFLLMEKSSGNVTTWSGVLTKCKQSLNVFHDFSLDMDMDRKVDNHRHPLSDI